jgi:hypothetical protein
VENLLLKHDVRVYNRTRRAQREIPNIRTRVPSRNTKLAIDLGV